jgi:hypothetical protein
MKETWRFQKTGCCSSRSCIVRLNLSQPHWIHLIRPSFGRFAAWRNHARIIKGSSDEKGARTVVWCVKGQKGAERGTGRVKMKFWLVSGELRLFQPQGKEPFYLCTETPTFCLLNGTGSDWLNGKHSRLVGTTRMGCDEMNAPEFLLNVWLAR